MNRKQQKTLNSIFETPTKANINFADIEKLLISLGAVKTEKGGSAVSFELGGEAVFFHRPHPQKEAKRYQVAQARDFLIRIGYE